MQNIHEMITLGFQNEHDLEHDPSNRPHFSAPKIYDANGDLAKRWYVYFSYRHPETGKMKRAKNIYGGANRFKTKEARYSLLTLYRKRLLKLLELGYSPFADNEELFREQQTIQQRGSVAEGPDLQNKEKNGNANNAVNPPAQEKSKETTIEKALDFALELKRSTVSPRTMMDYRNRCNLFCKWLREHRTDIGTIEQLDRKTVTSFLNAILAKTSPRNRNNYRTCLSAIFQTLEEMELLPLFGHKI